MKLAQLKEKAKRLDTEDKLAPLRSRFHYPAEILYFCGNSLGLQPKTIQEMVLGELEDWAKLAVEGHLSSRRPWYSYHELLTPSLANLCGAKPIEVVAMNSLTVNLHLGLVSFYRPSGARFKVLIEGGAFPSDRYAIESHFKWHGVDPRASLIEVFPREGEGFIRTEDLCKVIEREKNTLSLILLGAVNYYSGQYFEIEKISQAAKKSGVQVGLDLAHAIGNVPLKLHDWGVDFAVWCSYKYLNAGPGAIGGFFVHEKHARDSNLMKFQGWWGHDKVDRFRMAPNFVAMPGAEGWQISNPPILQLAALKGSLNIFDSVGMKQVFDKSLQLTSMLEEGLEGIPGITLLTPKERKERGAQLSYRVKRDAKGLVERLWKQGVRVDYRAPDVLRMAPVALYNSFSEVVELSSRIEEGL